MRTDKNDVPKAKGGVRLWVVGGVLGISGLSAFSEPETLLAAPFLFGAAFLVLPPGWAFTCSRWPAMARIGTLARSASVFLALVILGSLSPTNDPAGKVAPVTGTTENSTQPSPPIAVPQSRITSRPVTRPNFSVIKEDVFHNFKRSLDIRIDKRVSEEELRTIALELKASDSKSYDRTFICFYLPGMEVGAGAWATSHFDPDLKITFNEWATKEGVAKLQRLVKKAPDGTDSRESASGHHRESPEVDPRHLRKGRAYTVSKETPLMPSHNPADPIAAIQQMKRIPAGGRFRIIGQIQKRNKPWYEVTAWDSKRKKIGRGWINSIALVGQDLSPLSTERHVASPQDQESDGARNETKAAGRLKLAKNLIRQDNLTGGKKWLADVIKLFPETEAAKEADKLLKEMGVLRSSRRAPSSKKNGSP